MIKQMVPFILVAVLIAFAIGFSIEKNTSVAENYQKYCETRTELAMNVYDEIKKGLPLYRINVYWDGSSIDRHHTYSRAKWWKDLKNEVGVLVREGKLSFRVKETIMERCLRGDELIVHHENKKKVISNETNS
jgi:hypothetical protein|tara:strand:- start:134 stop:532 length:399 start_codon:yes stop_codon:yes gene_type:complete